MPTGTLMKKIHSQPRVSTRKPPASGPTRMAMPATEPHRLIARPRRSGGKVRVITAMVCGVISAAPRPWNTRAVISMAAELDSPHQAEAAVNSTRPVR